MARSKTKLRYGEDNADFTLFFEKEELRDLTKVDRSMYQEALDRFGSLIVENIEKRNDYEFQDGDADAGIKSTLRILTAIEDIEHLEAPKDAITWDDSKLVYQKDNRNYTFYFTYESFDELPDKSQDLYAEAIAMFATILLDNLHKREEFYRLEGDANYGVKQTIEMLKTANNVEDGLVDKKYTR